MTIVSPMSLITVSLLLLCSLLTITSADDVRGEGMHGDDRVPEDSQWDEHVDFKEDLDRVAPARSGLLQQNKGDGTETLKITMPQENLERGNMMRCVVSPWPKDGYIVGVQAAPTSRQKIHHMTLFACEADKNEVIDAHQQGQPFDCKDTSPNNINSCIMVAGFEHMSQSAETPHVTFPEGVVLPVGSANARYKFAVLEVHNNAPLKDASGFHVDIKRTAPPHLGTNLFFQLGWDIKRDQDSSGIPPGKPDFKITRTHTAAGGPFSVFMVHLHYHSIGKDFTLELETKHGHTKTLAHRIGSKGQTVRLHPAVTIQEGDKMIATVTWDSSDRSEDTPWGMDPVQNEMCDVFLGCSGSEHAPITWLDGIHLPQKIKAH